jgi:hypothetical protein
MGTKFKTPEEKFEYRISKQSVEADVIVITKPKTTWQKGIPFLKLKAEVEKRRKREYSEGRIYEAISLINRFGRAYGIYLRSAYGWAEKLIGKSKLEYRYFVPTDDFDIQKEKMDLENKKVIVGQKEAHLEHHEKVTIPQEQKIAQIQRG